MSKPKVLVMVDWFAPGFKAGGPIQSAVNFTDHLEDELDIYVFTTDRDLGDSTPYPVVKTDCWVERQQHHVFYATPAFLSWRNIRMVIRALAPDYIYVNSMFSRFGTVYPLLMKRLGLIDSRIVLAPRGMLKESALAHKVTKKKIFLKLFRIFGLFRNIAFHVTDDTELRDVLKHMGRSVNVFKAGNLAGRLFPFREPPQKTPGSLEMVFVGRFHPIKNLEFLLEVLRGIDGRINLLVIATPEDRDYQKKCEALVNGLPERVSVRMLLNIPHEKIEAHILSSHIFALPTRGENFGHAIFEALSAGRPVLISDQTPWRDLESGLAGWDLSLERMDDWRSAVRAALDWNQATLEAWCRGAWNKAAAYLSDHTLKQTYLKQFK